jgi:molybdopterin-guanine dinucleotide biosynthesis protein A
MTTAAIIAGGKAERLGGQPKGLIEIDGRRIVDRQLEALRAVFDRVFMVANDPGPWSDLGIAIVPDRVPGAGPLAGLDAALAALAPGEEAVACVAGDMPFLDPRALALLRDHPPAQAVVPRVGGLPDPLFARYARSCAPIIARALAEGRLKTRALLAELDVAYLDEPALHAVDPTLRFLTNINTPEDLAGVKAG